MNWKPLKIELVSLKTKWIKTYLISTLQWTQRIKFNKKNSNNVRLRLQLKCLKTKNCSNLKRLLRKNNYLNQFSPSWTTSNLLNQVITNLNKISSIKCSILINFTMKIWISRAWIIFKQLFRSVLCIKEFHMDLLLFNLQILTAIKGTFRQCFFNLKSIHAYHSLE
jgi:hypothetical protein